MIPNPDVRSGEGHPEDRIRYAFFGHRLFIDETTIVTQGAWLAPYRRSGFTSCDQQSTSQQGVGVDGGYRKPLNADLINSPEPEQSVNGAGFQ